jgi:hypothetical protein
MEKHYLINNESDSIALNSSSSNSGSNPSIPKPSPRVPPSNQSQPSTAPVPIESTGSRPQLGKMLKTSNPANTNPSASPSAVAKVFQAGKAPPASPPPPVPTAGTERLAGKKHSSLNLLSSPGSSSSPSSSPSSPPASLGGSQGGTGPKRSSYDGVITEKGKPMEIAGNSSNSSPGGSVGAGGAVGNSAFASQLEAKLANKPLLGNRPNVSNPNIARVRIYQAKKNKNPFFFFSESLQNIPLTPFLVSNNSTVFIQSRTCRRGCGY